MMPSQIAAQPAISTVSQLLRLTTSSLILMLVVVAFVHLLRHEHAADTARAFELWVAATICGAAMLVSRIAWRRSGRRPTTVRASNAMWTITTLAVLLCGAALTFSAESPVNAVAIWTILFAFECCAWVTLSRVGSTGALAPASAAVETVRRTVASTLLAEPESGGAPSELLLRDEHVVQQATRSRSEAGDEFVHGLIRCRFEAGERNLTQHTAFCPPLESPPSVLVTQVDGPAAKVNAAQAETFGVRFELRLGRTCRRPTDVVIEFFASTCDESRHTRVA